MRMQAVFNGRVIAESDDTVVVEGNHYFPPESLDRDCFSSSETHSVCPWKGRASYYSVEVDGVTSRDAAWYYPKPSPLARRVKGRVAFWRGVEVRPHRGEHDDAGTSDGVAGDASASSPTWT